MSNTEPNKGQTKQIAEIEDATFKDLLEVWNFVKPGEDILTINQKVPTTITTKAILTFDFIGEKLTVKIHPSQ